MKKSNAKNAKRYRDRTKELVFNYYGNDNPKCVTCNENELSKLTIGHINDDGSEDRKKTGMGSNFYTWLKLNNFPNNGYEISCFSCNCGKRIGDVKKKEYFVTSNSLISSFKLMP